MKKFLKTISFLALAFLFIASLFVLVPDLQAGSADDMLFGGESGNFQAATGLGNTDIRVIIGNVIRVALGFLGIIAVIFILYGGWLYMTSQGDASQIDKAKKVLISAAIGLVIIMASFGLASFVINQLYDATGSTGGTMTCSATNVGVCNGCARCVDNGGGNYVWMPDMSCSGCMSGGTGTVNCDGNPMTAVCDPDNTICDGDFAPGTYFCDVDAGCTCQPLGGVGDPCDADPGTPSCDNDDDLCMADLRCEDDVASPNLCTCVGAPIIDYISPVGMFCRDAFGDPTDDACRSDEDCTLIDATYTGCDVDTPNGAPGNFITIGGRFFGNTPGSVWFWDGSDFNIEASFPSSVNSNCGNTWQEEQIVVVVPSGVAASGPIKIERDDGDSDTTDNSRGIVLNDFVLNTIERPGLCLVDNTEPPANTCSGLDCGFLDDSFNLQGTLFSGTEQDLRFGDIFSSLRANNISGWSNTAVNASVPNVSAGANTIFVEIDENISNYLGFEVKFDSENQPIIDYINPNSGPIGQYVTIYGSGFKEYVSGTSLVQFTNPSFGTFNADGLDFPVECQDSWWNDTFITVKVPPTIGSDIGSYEVSVINNLGNESESENFTVTSGEAGPGICLLSPANGPVNQAVDVYGDNFGDIQGSSFVRFYNNVTATVYSGWTAQVIGTNVPTDASSGPVQVSTSAGLSNSLPFMVGYCSNDSQCNTGQECCGLGTYWSGICRPAGDCNTGGPNISGYGWSFSTSPGEPPAPLVCGGYSNNAACISSDTCPNSLGECATRSGAVTGECGDSYCNSKYSICFDSCVYNGSLDLCQADSSPLSNVCDTTSAAIVTGYTAECRSVSNMYSGQRVWQVKAASCPSGTFPEINGWCTVGTPGSPNVCDSCSNGFVCIEGECYVSEKVCGDGSTCNASDECVLNNDVCECCCRVGFGMNDCCYGLTCSAGGCGDDPVNYGLCSGCRVDLNGNDTDLTPEEQVASDLACNCTGTSGKYCQIEDPTDPNDVGVCRDATPCDGDEYTATCDPENSMCGTGQYCDTSTCFCKQALPCDDNEIVADGCNASSNCDASTQYCDSSDCYCKPLPACDADDNLNNGCSRDNNKCPADMYCGNDCYCHAGVSCDNDILTPGCDAASNCGDGFVCDSTDCTCRPANGGAANECVSPLTACNSGFYGCDVGYDCLDNAGADCRCCCDPNNDLCEGSLVCWPNQGDCTGTDRGLCCGCESDSECSGGSDGCGDDTCCYSRPMVNTVSPLDDATEVCRNTIITAEFDQKMDIASFSGNVIVVGDYGVDGVCPQGTNYLVYNQQKNNNNFFVKAWSNILKTTDKILRPILGDNFALAYTPADNLHNYCAVKGKATGYNNAVGNGVLTFELNEVLDPNRLYYVIVKGDDNFLDSQHEGVVSFRGISMVDSASNPVEDYTFNGISFANSHVWSFTTGLEICELSYVTVEPNSYLFQTSNTDQSFQAFPKSMNGDVITATSDYDWSWEWTSDNPIVAEVSDSDDPIQTVTSKNVQDGRTYINAKATVTVDNVITPSTVGSTKRGLAQVFVLLCENPWPQVSKGPTPPAGTWYPWRDNVEGAATCVGNCSDTNYELYYCRDFGKKGTYDDLPAIMDDSTVVLGSSLKCSDPNFTCTGLNYGDTCGAGVCEYNIFKEAYFFREDVPTATTTLSVASLAVGEGATASWDIIPGVNGYKLYWGEASASYPNYAEVDNLGVSDRDDVNCSLSGTSMDCEVSGLENNQIYYFNLSSYAETESALFAEVSVEIKDITPPSAPIILNTDPLDKAVALEWNEVIDAVEYIVYFTNEVDKANAGNYPFYTDPVGSNILEVPGLNNGETYYFVVTALDESGNESLYSNQVSDIPVVPSCGNGVCDAGECSSGCSSDCGVSDCCGIDGCNVLIGEDNANCSSDCSGTPVIPADPSCGNGLCETGECTAGCSSDCSVSDCCGIEECNNAIGENEINCSSDCGIAPPPPPPPPP
jgi:hypothetical protein